MDGRPWHREDHAEFGGLREGPVLHGRCPVGALEAGAGTILSKLTSVFHISIFLGMHMLMNKLLVFSTITFAAGECALALLKAIETSTNDAVQGMRRFMEK